MYLFSQFGILVYPWKQAYKDTLNSLCCLLIETWAWFVNKCMCFLHQHFNSPIKMFFLIHKFDDDKKDVPPNSHPLWAHLPFSHLICYFLFLSAVHLSYKPKSIFHGENDQTTGITSISCMNKHQPQSVGINWYPLLWLLYRLPSLWTWLNCGSLYIHLDSW
jgi:hypothetical protein